jgi:hypothetical protein
MIHLSTYLRNLMAISYFSPDHGFPFCLLQNMNTIEIYRCILRVCYPAEVSEYEQVSSIGISSCIAQIPKRQAEVGTDGLDATNRPIFNIIWQYFHSVIGPCMFTCINCVIFVSGTSVGILLTAYSPLPLSTLFSSPLYRIPPEASGKCESACCFYSTRKAENFCKRLQCLSYRKKWEEVGYFPKDVNISFTWTDRCHYIYITLTLLYRYHKNSIAINYIRRSR